MRYLLLAVFIFFYSCDLFFATPVDMSNPTGWEEMGTIATSMNNSFYGLSMRFNQNGVPYIAFKEVDGTGRTVFIVRRENSVWTSLGDAVVGGTASTFNSFSMDLDSAGNPYLCLVSNQNTYMAYRWFGDNRETLWITNAGAEITAADIAVGHEGRIYMGFTLNNQITLISSNANEQAFLEANDTSSRSGYVSFDVAIGNNNTNIICGTAAGNGTTYFEGGTSRHSNEDFGWVGPGSSLYDPVADVYSVMGVVGTGGFKLWRIGCGQSSPPPWELRAYQIGADSGGDHDVKLFRNPINSVMYFSYLDVMPGQSTFHIYRYDAGIQEMFHFADGDQKNITGHAIAVNPATGKIWVVCNIQNDIGYVLKVFRK